MNTEILKSCQLLFPDIPLLSGPSETSECPKIMYITGISQPVIVGIDNTLYQTVVFFLICCWSLIIFERLKVEHMIFSLGQLDNFT